MNAQARNFVQQSAAAPRPRAVPDFRALVAGIDRAEEMIVTSVERECDAIRAGRMLAAWALHQRLVDAASLYASAVAAARESLASLRYEALARQYLEERRLAFEALLKVEFAVLAAAKAAADPTAAA